MIIRSSARELFKHGLNVDFLFLLTLSVVLTDFHFQISAS